MTLDRLPDDLRALDRSAMLALLEATAPAWHRTALTRAAIDELAKTAPAPNADHVFLLLHRRLVAHRQCRLQITTRGRAAAELIARAIAFEAQLHHVIQFDDHDHVAAECTCGAWSARFAHGAANRLASSRTRLAIAIREHVAGALAEQMMDVADAG